MPAKAALAGLAELGAGLEGVPEAVAEAVPLPGLGIPEVGSEVGGMAVTPDTATPPGTRQPTTEVQVGEELITSPEANAQFSPESPLSPSPPGLKEDDFPMGLDMDINGGGSGSEEDPDKDDFAE